MRLGTWSRIPRESVPHSNGVNGTITGCLLTSNIVPNSCTRARTKCKTIDSISYKFTGKRAQKSTLLLVAVRCATRRQKTDDRYAMGASVHPLFYSIRGACCGPFRAIVHKLEEKCLMNGVTRISFLESRCTFKCILFVGSTVRYGTADAVIYINLDRTDEMNVSDGFHEWRKPLVNSSFYTYKYICFYFSMELIIFLKHCFPTDTYFSTITIKTQF